MGEPTADREIVVFRSFDAPPETVFAAFTEREHVEQWWVPRGTITHEWNATPGGLWRYSMPGPDGASYPFRIKFIEISKPRRLVYDYGTDADEAPAPVRTTVTFEDEGGKTKVTLQLAFASAAEREETVKRGGAKGARMALDSLAEYLARR
jgi:uncharacterized protein YndB with AHSA1/START domain